jgi:hypothetical protein
MGRPTVERFVYGMLAGIAATVGMTAAMRRMHARLPAEERYPLPPREITGRIGGGFAGADAAMLSLFGYGALTGGLFALQERRALGLGALYGIGVWAASYFGWVPFARMLAPASHPPSAQCADDRRPFRVGRAARRGSAGDRGGPQGRLPTVAGRAARGQPRQRMRERPVTHPGHPPPSSITGVPRGPVCRHTPNDDG